MNKKQGRMIKNSEVEGNIKKQRSEGEWVEY